MEDVCLNLGRCNIDDMMVYFNGNKRDKVAICSGRRQDEVPLQLEDKEGRERIWSL